MRQESGAGIILGLPSPFFPGIIFFPTNRQTPRGNGWFLERTMDEKNGTSTPRILRMSHQNFVEHPRPFLYQSGLIPQEPRRHPPALWPRETENRHLEGATKKQPSKAFGPASSLGESTENGNWPPKNPTWGCLFFQCSFDIEGRPQGKPLRHFFGGEGSNLKQDKRICGFVLRIW